MSGSGCCVALRPRAPCCASTATPWRTARYRRYRAADRKSTRLNSTRSPGGALPFCLMSDEWKWVLRSASPTRPVLRFNGDAVANSTVSTVSRRRTAVFSDTRGVFQVSAGEGSVASGTANEADMGTAFALATSLYGNNMLQVSGNVGYGSQTGVPAAAFRTSYSRSLGGGNPEVSLTMRQLYLPGRLGAALTGNEGALPMLRTMAASFDDRTALSDELTVQYGFTLNSVSFLDHLNYASPY